SPLPPGIKRDAPEGTVGACIKAGNTYLIGVHRLLQPPARLSTFFHEYGHAIYGAESNEDDSEGPGLVLSETAAMLSSLRLPDEEGLSEVAVVSATAILPTGVCERFQKSTLAKIRSLSWSRLNASL